MASTRHERQEETRFRVMRLLSEQPEITTRQIAKEVGTSNGAAYYCVTALIEGSCKDSNFSKSDRKSHYLYQLTPRGVRQKAILTANLLDRKLHIRDLKEIERLETDLGLREEEARD